MQHFGCSWEVGFPRAEAELGSLFVALAPSDCLAIGIGGHRESLSE
jgi:hypothetical protein